MSNMMTEGHSILRPPYFNGENYSEWKERMKIFIQSVDFKIWFVIKNGPKIPRKQIGNEEVEKSEDEYDEEDMKNMEVEAKARNILNCAMNPDTLEKISSCQTAKLIWDTLNREMISTSPTSHPPPQMGAGAGAASANYNFPDPYYVEGIGEAEFLRLCVPLHKHALQGNWTAAEQMLRDNPRLKCAAIASWGWPTVLHVAAGTHHVPFVKALLDTLQREHAALQDFKGNTAFCFAAASGNMDIARLLLDKNDDLPTIRGSNGRTPIQFAVWQGRCDMAWFLYDLTTPSFQDKDWELLFFTCINTGSFHMALKIASEKPQLAFARDENRETALHLLAQNQEPLESYCHRSEHQNHTKINPGMENHVFFQLVKVLWNEILRQRNFQEAVDIISKPSQVLFDAAEVGNFGFLSELLTAQPSLIWEVDDKGRSIIHTAVLHRHASIFNLIHEIGSLKDIIVTYRVKEENTENNTLLHLAAYLAPRSQLELVSGAALQMCLEIAWFEEVKKIIPPSHIKLRNSKNLTAQKLFTLEHEKLREKGEAWMKRTAEFCIIVSTVIATAVFSAAINVPGGIDDQTNKPNYLDNKWFLVFAISDAAAFISSAIATLIFLSILISRYGEYDFYKSLPLKLISGLLTLFISITCMMVAFGSAFFITYYYGLKLVPDSISLLAILPMFLYIVLQFSLWSDIIYSTFYCRTLFKPSIPMIYQTQE